MAGVQGGSGEKVVQVSPHSNTPGGRMKAEQHRHTVELSRTLPI